MVQRSYDPHSWSELGIVHRDMVMRDGGCPSKDDVRRALRSASAAEAILVHCKGGFGRSVVLACCLIVDRYDVPGEALLGWVRVARPGAINSTRQERFLTGLRGRADLQRFA